jgi:predicted nucleotidyltransferase
MEHSQEPHKSDVDKCGFNVDNLAMRQEEVTQTLDANRRELVSKFGVQSLALFGSVVRDEAGDSSDIDMLVEFNRPTCYFGLVALQEHLSKLLQQSVDLGTLQGLKPRVRARVEQEMRYVF